MTKTRGRHEGSVYQRSDGRFVAEISVGYKLNGKRDKRSSYHKTKQEATKALSKLRNAQETGTLSNAQGITLEAHLKSWLEFKKPSLKPNTVHTYQDFITRLIVPKLGKIKLEKLSALQLDQFYKALSDQGYAPRTPRVLHAFLHGALKQALRWGLVPRNVADAATPPKAAQNEMKFWKPEEAMRFLEFAKPHRLHALFFVALLTGLRSGELRALRWQDIDLTNKRLSVQRNLSQINGVYHFDTPKTRNSRRIVFFADDTVAVLQKHLERQNAEKIYVGAAWQNPELVFASEVGTPLEQRNLQRLYKSMVKVAGVSDIRFHDLRHTAASLLIRQGVPIKLVSDRLGHSNTAFTSDVYIHLYPEQRQQAAMSLTDLCRPSNALLN